jgi:fructoselysine 6-phosphate deglycase
LHPPSLPLRPIESDIVPVLARATSQRKLTRDIAREARSRNVNRVVFTGVGGSWASSVPANILLGSHPTAFSSENVNATEFTDLYLPSIDERTLVVAASHSGGTPETVAAAQGAADRGALVVSLSSEEDNPLARAARFQLTYRSARTITSAKYVLLAELCLSLFEAFDVPAAIEDTRKALDAVPRATAEAVEAAEPTLAAVAKRYAQSSNIHVLAAGPLAGLAYMLSVCYLVEQQWMQSAYFLAADFFHGPFEVAQGEQPYLVLSGEDGTRPQTDRVVRFLRRYHDNFEVVDVADLALTGIDPASRGAVGHIPMAAVVARLADHFESISGHDLDTRRYMYRVEY